MKSLKSEDRIASILKKQNWNITKIQPLPFYTGGGLLNGPVLKYRITHDNKTTTIAVKNVTKEPRFLFRSLYSEYGHANTKQLHLFDQCCSFLSMNRMPEREMFFYTNRNSSICQNVPQIYGMEYEGQTLILLMEDLSYCIRMDQIETPHVWSSEDICLAVETLAMFHHVELCPKKSLPHWEVSEQYDTITLFLEEFNDSMNRYVTLRRIPQVDTATENYLRNLSEYETRLKEYRKILIHNDFNIRNICLDSKNKKIKVYDWEFIDYGNPIMDLVDLFLSLSPGHLEKANLDVWMNLYIEKASAYGETGLNLSTLKEQLYYNTVRYSATRMNMYFLFYLEGKKSYIERMYRNLFKLIIYCESR
ncbi:aminoglycoside phosphotransferase family protein [Eisenbergiella sp.]